MSTSSVSSKLQIKEADRRPNGRHLRDASGIQLCFARNRSSDGCAAVCPGSRAHTCEWCLGSHRAVACPQHMKNGLGGGGERGGQGLTPPPQTVLRSTFWEWVRVRTIEPRSTVWEGCQTKKNVTSPPSLPKPLNVVQRCANSDTGACHGASRSSLRSRVAPAVPRWRLRRHPLFFLTLLHGFLCENRILVKG